MTVESFHRESYNMQRDNDIRVVSVDWTLSRGTILKESTYKTRASFAKKTFRDFIWIVHRENKWPEHHLNDTLIFI